MMMTTVRETHLGALVLLLLWTAGSSMARYDTRRAQAGNGIPPTASNNQVLHLIVRAYVDGILRELMEEGEVQSTEALFGTIRERMRDLPEHLNSHPALRQKRLWVGWDRPEFDPLSSADPQDTDEDLEEEAIDVSTVSPRDSKPIGSKRFGSVYPAEEICSSHKKWTLINETTDLQAHRVEIIHTEMPQYVFVYECVAAHGPCLGISPLYTSKCEMRNGWMNMYHRRKDVLNAPPKWGFVAVPHHCGCKITAKFIP